MGIVEIQWRKSSFSTDSEGNCLELAQHEGSIVMRESDAPGTVVTTSRTKLEAFIRSVKAGAFDQFLG
ncbi:DUF397 domain-containing protein [Streptomyces spiramyceticus]|uniref:DUF397 domain-containing protein n=1 Tax=Streptomyces spiramyceticus TaxID=299717 RepID=UPI00237B2CD5|nr:DUF397 domain-containing protein [Streptomyces spiramyceticus]